jgi:hypothetical protein
MRVVLMLLAAVLATVALHVIQEARWNAYVKRWHREHPGRRGVLK